jgi:hypothetical protein
LLKCFILVRDGDREAFSMSELSEDDVVAIVGPIGDAAVAGIIATGINKDQLIAAHDRVVRDQKAGDPGPPMDPGPFSQTVVILERLRRDGLLGEAGSTLT